MKGKMKTLTKILITLSIAMSLCFCFTVLERPSHADAGYHSSYSGGSSHSSSSYSGSSHSSSYSSSSSSRSRSSGSSYSSSGGSSAGAGIVVMFVWIVIIVVIVLASRRKPISNYTPPLNKITPNQAAIAKLKQLIPGFDEKQFLDQGYKIFLDVEDAWMNFELEKVHNEITDELFNMYESQISSMEVKGEQNIMSDFVLKDCAITNCKNENDDIEVTTKYIIEFYDYIIDKASGRVLRGTKARKLRMYYDFTFIKSTTENKIDKCPNCGAEVKVNSAGLCEYCGTKIVGENTSWVMSKKVCTTQTML